MRIKRIISTCFIAALALFSINANAGNIDVNAARSAAKSFLYKQATATRGLVKAPAMADIKLAYTEASKVEGNAFYVFNIDGGGWIIMAGDDRAKQVLAYGDKGNIDMNELPGNMKDYLQLYKNQIEEMQSYKGAVVPIKANNRVTPVAPLTKSTWGQSEPMNRYCPMKGSERTSVGCGPLAMAQILYYWKYPSGSDAMSSYYVYGGAGSVPALEATTFDYNLMLDKYTVYNPNTGGVSLGTYTEEQANEVAKLCRYCGHACNTRYGNSGTSSGSYTYDQRDAFKFFGYNDVTLLGIDPSWYCSNSSKYTEEEWKALISVELEAGRPIAYHNVDFIDGHAWVLDGVDADGRFHMNWGFYERFDGWFEFGAFTIYPNGETWNFNGSGNEMVINIIPPGGGVTIGDVDMDGEVGISDVSALIDYLLNGDATGIDLRAADVDKDGEIGIGDVSDLIDILLNSTH